MDAPVASEASFIFSHQLVGGNKHAATGLQTELYFMHGIVQICRPGGIEFVVCVTLVLQLQRNWSFQQNSCIILPIREDMLIRRKAEV